jgi:hypothetical protein
MRKAGVLLPMEEFAMASISLFNSNSLLSTVPSTGTIRAANTSSQPKTASITVSANTQSDTVKLSQTAQAKLLHSQGQSVSNIANSLGTTTKEIDNDLGITLEKELEKTLQETESSAK